VSLKLLTRTVSSATGAYGERVSPLLVPVGRESHLFWCLWGESLISSGACGERVSSLLVPMGRERVSSLLVPVGRERVSSLLRCLVEICAGETQWIFLEGRFVNVSYYDHGQFSKSLNCTFKVTKVPDRWWSMPLIPALGRQRQVDFWVWGQPGLQNEFQDSQGYTEKPCLENNNNNNNKIIIK
jgi:hypothetical protein